MIKGSVRFVDIVNALYLDGCIYGMKNEWKWVYDSHVLKYQFIMTDGHSLYTIIHIGLNSVIKNDQTISVILQSECKMFDTFVLFLHMQPARLSQKYMLKTNLSAGRQEEYLSKF